MSGARAWMRGGGGAEGGRTRGLPGLKRHGTVQWCTVQWLEGEGGRDMWVVHTPLH